MVEREIAGLVDSQDQFSQEAEQQPIEEVLAVLEAPESTDMTESPLALILTSTSSQNENEQQMNEIFDFLHKKLAHSGIADAQWPIAGTSAPEEPRSSPPLDLPPPPVEGEDQLEAVLFGNEDQGLKSNGSPEDEQAPVPIGTENQEMESLFSHLKLKLALDGIQVSSSEQAAIAELAEDRYEDTNDVTHLSPLPTPPSIVPLPIQPYVIDMPEPQALCKSSRARLLLSRAEEQSIEPNSSDPTRSGIVDTCARCSSSIPDANPRLLALGQVYHQECFTCLGTWILLPLRFIGTNEPRYRRPHRKACKQGLDREFFGNGRDSDWEGIFCGEACWVRHTAQQSPLP